MTPSCPTCGQSLPEEGRRDVTSQEAAAEIGRLATRMCKLASVAGLHVGITIAAAKPKVSDEAIAADVAGGTSLRDAAKKHGVGVGRIRGAVARLALRTARDVVDQREPDHGR